MHQDQQSKHLIISPSSKPLDSFYTSLYPKDSKIMLVGVYPPPLGGVSIHIQRLGKSLELHGYKVEYFDTSKKQSFKGQIYLRFLWRLLFSRYDIIHFHYSNNLFFVFCSLIRKIKPGKAIYLTSHNPRLFHSIPESRKKGYLSFIEKLDALIVVHDHILETYQSHHVKLPERTYVKNAFIEPFVDQESVVLASYPREILDFIENHHPIITANASYISFYNEIDVYGLDLCIELTAKIRNSYPQVGFIFALANDSINRDYLTKMKHRIKELNIESNFYFLSGQQEIWPLFKKADVMIRPTNTDGFSISIAEAQWLICPVVASNACDRPSSVILFENRDLEDLIAKCSDILENTYHEKQKIVRK